MLKDIKCIIGKRSGQNRQRDELESKNKKSSKYKNGRNEYDEESSTVSL